MEPSFSRTGNGLSNYHLFLNTEKVFFCEGKDIIQGAEGACLTLDVSFWKIVLEEKFAQADFKVVPCGSAGQVMSNVLLAQEAKAPDKEQSRVFGCIDRDYEDFPDFNGFSRIHDRIVTTEGYSVENDLLALVGVQRLIRFIVPRASKEIQEKIEDSIKNFSRFMGLLHPIDVHFKARGVEYLPTDGIPSFISEERKLSCGKYVIKFHKYKSFKEAKLRKAGLQSLASLKSLQINNRICGFGSRDGAIICPGKMVLKSLAHIINAFGGLISSWTPTGMERMVDVMLSIIIDQPASAIREMRSTTFRSWASMTTFASDH